MDRKRWAALAAAAVAVAAVAVAVWAGAQSSGSGDEAPQEHTDAPASSPDPGYWDEERMEEATPAPMPTVD